METAERLERPEAREGKLLTDKNLHILNMICFVSMMSNALSSSYTLISETFNVTANQVGMMNTLYSTPMIFLSLVVGIIADRFGRKKVMGISTLLFGASAIISLTATNFNMILLGEFLRGCGQPGIVIISLVLVGDLYESQKRRTDVMGINTAVLNIGLAIFPLVGGWLAGYGWKYPYLIILVAIPAALVVFFGMDEPKIQKQQEKLLPYLKDALKCFKQPRAVVLPLINFCVYAMLSGCFLVYMPFMVIAVLDKVYMIGIVMSVMAVTSCILSALLGPLSRKFSAEWMEIAALVIFIAAFIIGAKTTTINGALLCSAIFGMGIGLNMPAIMAMILPLADTEVRGAFISVTNLIKRAGQAVGPIIFGWIFVQWNLAGVFYGAAILSAVTLVLAFIFFRNNKTQM